MEILKMLWIEHHHSPHYQDHHRTNENHLHNTNSNTEGINTSKNKISEGIKTGENCHKK